MKQLSLLLLVVLGLCVAVPVSAADPKADKPAKEKPKEEKPLVGMLITRPGGGFLNIRVEGGNFVVAFLDKEKEEAKADLFRAYVRYRNRTTHADKRFILERSGDGLTLRAPTVVERPYLFKPLYISCFNEQDLTNAVESYTVNFSQLTPGDGATIPADEMTPEQIQKIAKPKAK